MTKRLLYVGQLAMFVYLIVSPSLGFAVPGVAVGIPEPEQRNVMVQLFNWRFKEIEAVIPQLEELGYKYVHVSPPQKSNEAIFPWFRHYQPVDYSKIEGYLGTEQEFAELNIKASQHGIDIIADVVFNHTIDVTKPPEPDFVKLDHNVIISEKFPQFEPDDFHCKCDINYLDTDSLHECWLNGTLADLKTESPHVRQIAKEYLQKLVGLGVDGFRFDAAKHIEAGFFEEILPTVPNKYSFGEIVEDAASKFPTIGDMDFYDFPLLAAMTTAFAFNQDLAQLKQAQQNGRALPGTQAVTFVRNHDIDRGQVHDGGIDDPKYGVGWNGTDPTPNRVDVNLAYAFILGREDGLPYVFVDMPTLPSKEQDDRFDDEDIVAGIRFHDLCLETASSPRRKDIWVIEEKNTIGWQRGTDRLVVINKALDSYPIRNKHTTLQKGTYRDVRTGWDMQVETDGTIVNWDVPGRRAVLFVRIGD